MALFGRQSEATISRLQLTAILLVRLHLLRAVVYAYHSGLSRLPRSCPASRFWWRWSRQRYE